jgi:uncharacterized protein (UPF0218 family)
MVDEVVVFVVSEEELLLLISKSLIKLVSFVFAVQPDKSRIIRRVDEKKNSYLFFGS